MAEIVKELIREGTIEGHQERRLSMIGATGSLLSESRVLLAYLSVSLSPSSFLETEHALLVGHFGLWSISCRISELVLEKQLFLGTDPGNHFHYFNVHSPFSLFHSQLEYVAEFLETR